MCYSDKILIYFNLKCDFHQLWKGISDTKEKHTLGKLVNNARQTHIAEAFP